MMEITKFQKTVALGRCFNKTFIEIKNMQKLSDMLKLLKICRKGTFQCRCFNKTTA